MNMTLIAMVEEKNICFIRGKARNVFFTSGNEIKSFSRRKKKKKNHN